MRFLDALRKVQTEQSKPVEDERSFREGTDQNEFLANPNLKYGTPTPLEKTAENFPNGKNSLNGKTGSAVDHPDHERTPHQFEFSEVHLNVDGLSPYLIAITEPSSPLCEAYRSLRTHLLSSAHRDGLKSIVVMSVDSTEGKSLTAVNLSWLLSQTEGVKALLIDGDLRRPSIERYLGIKVESGLVNVLEESVPLSEAIVRINPGGLHLLSSGTTNSDVAEIIAGPRFKSIMAEVSQIFDVIIIDTPPLRLFSDATVISNAADGALMIIKSDHLRYKDAQRVLGMIPNEKLIGTVLNQAEMSMIGDSHYDYNYYKSP